MLLNYLKLFKLRLINGKYSEKKLKHYLRKWYDKRKENPFVNSIIKNIIIRTPITG